MDCYDLKDCPGECPPDGWDDCELNPEVQRELAAGRKVGAVAGMAIFCFFACIVIGLALWLLSHVGVLR